MDDAQLAELWDEAVRIVDDNFNIPEDSQEYRDKLDEVFEILKDEAENRIEILKDEDEMLKTVGILGGIGTAAAAIFFFWRNW